MESAVFVKPCKYGKVLECNWNTIIGTEGCVCTAFREPGRFSSFRLQKKLRYPYIGPQAEYKPEYYRCILDLLNPMYVLPYLSRIEPFEVLFSHWKLENYYFKIE